MPQIKVYHEQNGKLTVRIPKGTIPDRATLEKVSQVMKDIRKTPAPCCNMERGKRAISPAKQEDCTTETVSRQELGEAMEIVSQLPQEDVEELTEIARDIIKGRGAEKTSQGERP